MIVLEINDDSAVIFVNAEKLDSSISQNLKTEIIAAHKQSVNKLVLDISSVRYCDSSGLGAILLANRTFNEDLQSFSLKGVQPNVLKIIQISQLEEILNFI